MIEGKKGVKMIEINENGIVHMKGNPVQICTDAVMIAITTQKFLEMNHKELVPALNHQLQQVIDGFFSSKVKCTVHDHEYHADFSNEEDPESAAEKFLNDFED